MWVGLPSQAPTRILDRSLKSTMSGRLMLPMFAAEIETASLADGLSWQPGQLLGGDLQARAPISYSPTFISPAESSKNFQSATSRGHQLKFPRPAGVGAGWGDHDLFREWQIHGRQVKRSMVENKEWCCKGQAAIYNVLRALNQLNN